MKKFFLYTFALAAMLITFASCSDEEYTDTKVTHYAEIVLAGEDFIVVDKGATFNEPGYSAEMNGEDVTKDVIVSSNVNTAKSGLYTVQYKYVNSDGFPAIAERTIAVLDPNDAYEGIYTVAPGTHRNSGGTITSYSGYEILILGNGDGTYNCEDLLAGYYYLRAGYGIDYAMNADIAIAEDGSVELLESFVPGWGDEADAFSGSFKDGNFEYSVTYAGSLVFNVTMVKN